MVFTQAKQGFTLIELLVVVLIIGILAAVALPQYQKAVMNGRYTQLVVTAIAISQAAEEYFLANGEVPKDIDNLSLDMDCEHTIEGRWLCNGFNCDFRSNKMVTCVNEDLLQNGYAVNINFPEVSQRTKYCLAISDDFSDKYHQFCKAKTENTTPFLQSILSKTMGVYKNAYWYEY